MLRRHRIKPRAMIGPLAHRQTGIEKRPDFHHEPIELIAMNEMARIFEPDDLDIGLIG
ncbi:MAG: hypothetical protein AVDCRST_MAG93-212, partial [uncultured Chloroflexia bacterium]